MHFHHSIVLYRSFGWPSNNNIAVNIMFDRVLHPDIRIADACCFQKGPLQFQIKFSTRRPAPLCFVCSHATRFGCGIVSRACIVHLDSAVQTAVFIICRFETNKNRNTKTHRINWQYLLSTQSDREPYASSLMMIYGGRGEVLFEYFQQRCLGKLSLTYSSPR